jgi:hypothetical protein
MTEPLRGSLYQLFREEKIKKPGVLPFPSVEIVLDKGIL